MTVYLQVDQVLFEASYLTLHARGVAGPYPVLWARRTIPYEQVGGLDLLTLKRC